MASPQFNEFCGRVCRRVRFRPDRAAITAELTAHLEDHMDALVARGFPPETAARQAVAAMGDPEEIGKELDKSHSPFLGWFQICFRVAVWGLAVLVLLFTLPQVGAIAEDLAAPLQDGGHLDEFLTQNDEYDIVADLNPGAVWHYEGYTFSIPRALVVRASDGTLSLHYTVRADHPNPWHRNPVFWDWLWAEDDLGNTYSSYGQVVPFQFSAVRSSGTSTTWHPFVSYYSMWVDRLDPAAEKLTLRFDRYGENAIYLTLSLKGGT
ncbi:permease prefix domain 1-containing protein [Flavonifractor sp. An10]|uniref:permease prefix domain 1-containing protein n=1 Tax=Flavonifractor sp. An10 TaxID=1965537 RepID=UPI000B3A46C0|nr:permease prefix domain 1-containing protein [Flavonifractor sp. An10]OUQ82099.1 hypothetical protein B5E42_11240 [Flavonifractor sp. An10]